MTKEQIIKLFEDTAYVRTGGSEAERKCAEQLCRVAATMGFEASLEPFEVDVATIKSAHLYVDGQEISCKGYLLCGSGEVEAPLYYLPSTDPYSLSQCKGKIVMIDGYLGYWMYKDLLANGAVGFITYDGNANYADEDMDQRELRPYVSEGNKILGVNINAKTAIALIRDGASTARIVIEQEESKGMSHNVVFTLPGEIEDSIVLTAHYDSTSLSQGSYDNMSGCVGLFGIAEHFKDVTHRYTLRFVFCGSEERGLLGSKAYVIAHEDELASFALNINLDMIGCIMGKFIACCSAEEALVQYITYLGSERGFGISARQDVYSSDSTPFADKGVPSLSFARLAPPNTATIHNRYDTPAVMKAEHMLADIEFITAFTDRMANAVRCPVGRDIPEKVKEKLDTYLCRKRAPK
ncbi:MAG: DUF4910 domain-containing protein [Clostridia bacterium]|nr:DUF4910 domain-containing protein [Clostridia bacterium]